VTYCIQHSDVGIRNVAPYQFNQLTPQLRPVGSFLDRVNSVALNLEQQIRLLRLQQKIFGVNRRDCAALASRNGN